MLTLKGGLRGLSLAGSAPPGGGGGGGIYTRDSLDSNLRCIHNINSKNNW